MQLTSGQKSWQTKLKKYGDQAIEQARISGSQGGKIGGKISPGNFKHDRQRAAEAGKKSKRKAVHKS